MRSTDVDATETDPVAPTLRTTRRNVLVGAGAAVAVTALSACSAHGSEADYTRAAKVSAGPLVKTADVPVGGGKILQSPQVVVTQPTAGTFKAFTSICTHMGCTVSVVADGTIQCGCHGSAFSITDGSVQQGPATEPLAAQAITVANDEVSAL